MDSSKKAKKIPEKRKKKLPAKPVPKDRYHHGDLRRALIDAAVDLIRSDGVAGCTLREAARRAGVSRLILMSANGVRGPGTP